MYVSPHLATTKSLKLFSQYYYTFVKGATYTAIIRKTYFKSLLRGKESILKTKKQIAIKIVYISQMQILL